MVVLVAIVIAIVIVPVNRLIPMRVLRIPPV
jgi:hypothetical protein